MFLATLLALCVTAGPTSAGELLRRGEKALAELEYEQAAEDLMRAASAADATPAQRHQAHLKAGIANRILGRDVDARLNFRAVLLAAPDTQLPEGTPPKVLSFFESVRQEVLLERQSAPPVPEEKRAPADPLTRALVAGGVTTGLGVVTLPLCAFCGGGACIICPGTCFGGAGALTGVLVALGLGGDSLVDNLVPVAAATAAGLAVTGLLGGATYGVTLLLSPSTQPFSFGNANLTPAANAAAVTGGFVTALASGAVAGGLVWLLMPGAPAPEPDDPAREPKDDGTTPSAPLAMAF